MSQRALPPEHVASLVHDATAAPSMHNAQPWRFRYFQGSRTFHVRADIGRVIPHADPDTRALHLGCGAALLNLRVAVTHGGWYPATQLLPDLTDPTLLATVQLTGFGSGESDLAALYPAIHQRHSSRFPFEETEIPEAVRTALSDAARLEGASLSFATAWHLEEVLELVEEAEARNRTDRGSDEDLATWTRIGTPSSVTSAPDGVPEYAFGPRKRGGKGPVRDFAGARSVAGRTATAFERSPNSPSSAPLAIARRTGCAPVRPWSTCCCWPPSKVCPARSSPRPWSGRTCAGHCETRCRAPPMCRWCFASATGPRAPAHHAAQYRRYSTSSPERWHSTSTTRSRAWTRHVAFSAGHFGLWPARPARRPFHAFQDLSGPPPPERADPSARARLLRADDAGGSPGAGVVGGGPHRLPVGGLGVDQGGIAQCGGAGRACGYRARDPPRGGAPPWTRSSRW